jgi:arsenite methyltransferase
MQSIKNQDSPDDVRAYVRERYGKAAVQPGCGCGDSSSSQGCCGQEDAATFSQVETLYQISDIRELPDEVTGLSLGCGDPVTLASLQPGQIVLDLGSGGGIDCFIAAKKVSESGRVIGVDMTPEMLDRARQNKQKLGVENVEFRLGEIEYLPVADNSIDVVISNCVINLSPDKPQVFREAFRVLRPGGRLSVSDIVTDGPLPSEIKRDLSSWAGCVAGAWDAREYAEAIKSAGFVEIDLIPQYFDAVTVEEAAEKLDLPNKPGFEVESYQKAIFSAKITARKPA